MEPPTKVPRLAPRRSARLQGLPPPRWWPNARCSPADASAPCWFVVLPEVVLFLVFAALPADARAGCASVCRAWAHILLRGADAWRFWTRLDLSGGSGVTCTKSDAALAGAAALARGRLQELDLSNRGALEDRDGIMLHALRRVLRGSPELRELALDGISLLNYTSPGQLEDLLTAAPSLQRLDAACVCCDTASESLPVLRAEPPFGPLRTQYLEIAYDDDEFRDAFHETPYLTEEPGESLGTVVGARRFGAALAHAWVRELNLRGMTWAEPAALDALTDALLARTCRVEQLVLDGKSIPEGRAGAFLPALARLLAGRDGAALTKVRVYASTFLFAAASAADVQEVCAALRGTALTHVELPSAFRFGWEIPVPEQVAAALRQAAAGNPRVRLVV